MSILRYVENASSGTAPLSNVALLAAMSAALATPAIADRACDVLAWSTTASASTSLSGGRHWVVLREAYAPRTRLAKRLLALRQQIAEDGGLKPAARIIESLIANRSA